MSKERINVYVTERQRRQLEKRSLGEGLPMAEIIRRALDAYLAWDDPTYLPMPIPRQGTAIPPADKSRGPFGRGW